MTMNSVSKLWWKDSVIYELYVDKFASNFKGLTSKLDYFNYLGVNALWLLPFYPSPMVDAGYDIADHAAVRKELGNLSDFSEFVDRAHKKDIRVIIDFVMNHTSDKHPWFSEASSSKDNPKRDWYMWSDTNDKYSEAFVHFSEIKSTNWIKNRATSDYYYATFYPQQPDLNWNNDQVYGAMIDIARSWLKKGVDGFRLDAISRLIKRENTNCFALPETHNILKRFRADLETEYPEVVLIAESGGWPWEAKGFFGDGDECQIVINFPLASNLLAAIQNRDMSYVEKVLADSAGIPEDSRWGVFLTNHDSVDLFFINDENQKNNLTRGGKLFKNFGSKDSPSFAARLSEICMGDKEKILWAIEKLLDLPGVPILYYGNEIGMPNAKFTGEPVDFREYVRGKFDWDAAEKQKKDPESMLNSVRKMISSRQGH